jgi:DNA-binding IclR family transcriptional regulator
MERISLAESAPALSRGLQALRLMSDGAAMTLDSLSRAAATPKASMLRLLRTLGAAGLVAQHPDSRRWTALARIVPIGDSAELLRASQARRLDRLVRAAGQVVELYARDGAIMRMIDRREPAEAAVSLRAQVGFVRDAVEVEAVAQVLLAFAAIAPAGGHYHCRGEEQVRLSLARVRAVAERVRSDGWSADLGVNRNGVRRVAVPLLDGAGECLGAIAIAALGPAAGEPALPLLRDLLLSSSPSPE